MTGEVDARATLLRDVVGRAGAAALVHWRNRTALVVEDKGNPQDVVSAADREVEAIIRGTVGRAFPEDGFLGEEYGGEPGRSGWLWVIDPIDGTAPFLAGHPTWCVSIAVRRADETALGAIAAPAAGETYFARRGHGSELDGAPLRIDAAITLRNRQTAVGASARSDPTEISGLVERLMRRGGMFYRNGSGALMLAYVAAGRLAGYVEPYMAAWDCLAGFLLIEEAGGRVAPYPPGRLEDGGPVLAAAPGAWDELRSVFEGR